METAPHIDNKQALSRALAVRFEWRILLQFSHRISCPQFFKLFDGVIKRPLLTTFLRSLHMYCYMVYRSDERNIMHAGKRFHTISSHSCRYYCSAT